MAENGVLVEAIGVETIGGAFTPLLSSGCRVPCVSTEIWSTAEDGQSELKLALYRGQVDVVSAAILLGRFRVTGFPPLPRGEAQVEITIAVERTDVTIEARTYPGLEQCRVARVPE